MGTKERKKSGCGTTATHNRLRFPGAEIAFAAMTPTTRFLGPFKNVSCAQAFISSKKLRTGYSCKRRTLFKVKVGIAKNSTFDL